MKTLLSIALMLIAGCNDEDAIKVTVNLDTLQRPYSIIVIDENGDTVKYENLETLGIDSIRIDGSKVEQIKSKQ